MTKQCTLYSAEAYSEAFPTSKQCGYLNGGNYFHKILHLICWKRFRIRFCPVKIIKPRKANTNPKEALKQAI